MHAKRNCASQLPVAHHGIGDDTGCDASPAAYPFLAPVECTLMNGVLLCTASRCKMQLNIAGHKRSVCMTTRTALWWHMQDIKEQMHRLLVTEEPRFKLIQRQRDIRISSSHPGLIRCLDSVSCSGTLLAAQVVCTLISQCTHTSASRPLNLCLRCSSTGRRMSPPQGVEERLCLSSFSPALLLLRGAPCIRYDHTKARS